MSTKTLIVKEFTPELSDIRHKDWKSPDTFMLGGILYRVLPDCTIERVNGNGKA